MGQWPFCPVPPAPGHLFPPAPFLWMDEESKAGAVCCAECSTVIVSPNAVRQLLFSRRGMGRGRGGYRDKATCPQYQL